MFSLNKVLDKLPEEKKNEIVDKNVEGGLFFLFSWFKRKRHDGHYSHYDSQKSSYGCKKSWW